MKSRAANLRAKQIVQTPEQIREINRNRALANESRKTGISFGILDGLTSFTDCFQPRKMARSRAMLNRGLKADMEAIGADMMQVYKKTPKK